MDRPLIASVLFEDILLILLEVARPNRLLEIAQGRVLRRLFAPGW